MRRSEIAEEINQSLASIATTLVILEQTQREAMVMAKEMYELARMNLEHINGE